MSNNNQSDPFATAGSGKSDAEVAFELVSKLKGQGVWGEKNMPAILDMFAECLDAVKGLRPYEGQNRVYAMVKMGGQDKAPMTQTVGQPLAHQAATAAPALQVPSNPMAVAAQPPVQQAAPAHNPVQTQQVQLMQQFNKPI